MKKTKMILLEPVLSKTVHSIVRTTLLLLSLTLTAISMPYVLNWSDSHSSQWQKGLPENWTKAFVQMETSSITGEGPTELELWLKDFSLVVSDPSRWLTTEGMLIKNSTVYAQSSHGSNFPEPFESVPPTDWFLNGEEEDALEPVTELQESPAASVIVPNKVLLYFTHSRESFLPYLPDTKDPNLAHNSKVNITQMGPFLKTAFEKRGVGTVLDRTDVVGNLKDNGLDYYAHAYDESRKVVQTATASLPGLTYLIDVHRDSARHDVTALEHEGKVYARVAFVVGGEHAESDKNLALAKKVHEKMNEKIPGISRDVYLKEGAGTNGKFNQDLSVNSLLLELGGVDNTFEEMQLSADIFAEVLSGIVLEAEAVSQP
ncbi:stage II sporulation protein P [Jeotgalibacillus proteolyticus]|uniref:stage II sporulation protein P n=1 Tax=Jeotgalibacillus proteolyticus TaxID=2082395 RepID=UPI003CEC58E6